MNYHTAEVSARVQIYVKEMKKLAYREYGRMTGTSHFDKKTKNQK